MTTQTHPDPQAALAALRNMLADSSDLPLRVEDDGYVVEGHWLHLIVTPAEPGIRAHQYVGRLDELETKLRRQVGPNVMLVPAMPD